jgi:hypothetical protein
LKRSDEGFLAAVAGAVAAAVAFAVAFACSAALAFASSTTLALAFGQQSGVFDADGFAIAASFTAPALALAAPGAVAILGEREAGSKQQNTYGGGQCLDFHDLVLSFLCFLFLAGTRSVSSGKRNTSDMNDRRIIR